MSLFLKSTPIPPLSDPLCRQAHAYMESGFSLCGPSDVSGPTDFEDRLIGHRSTC